VEALNDKDTPLYIGGRVRLASRTLRIDARHMRSADL